MKNGFVQFIFYGDNFNFFKFIFFKFCSKIALTYLTNKLHVIILDTKITDTFCLISATFFSFFSKLECSVKRLKKNGFIQFIFYGDNFNFFKLIFFKFCSKIALTYLTNKLHVIILDTKITDTFCLISVTFFPSSVR